MPILSILFIAIGIWGGSLVGVDWKGVDSGSFWSVMQNSVSWSYDILNGFIKAVFFAVAVTWIALLMVMIVCQHQKVSAKLQHEQLCTLHLLF